MESSEDGDLAEASIDAPHASGDETVAQRQLKLEAQIARLELGLSRFGVSGEWLRSTPEPDGPTVAKTGDTPHAPHFVKPPSGPCRHPGLFAEDAEGRAYS